MWTVPPWTVDTDYPRFPFRIHGIAPSQRLDNVMSSAVSVRVWHWFVSHSTAVRRPVLCWTGFCCR